MYSLSPEPAQHVGFLMPDMVVLNFRLDLPPVTYPTLPAPSSNSTAVSTSFPGTYLTVKCDCILCAVVNLVDGDDVALGVRVWTEQLIALRGSMTPRLHQPARSLCGSLTNMYLENQHLKF